jgi:hypothetical protein
VKIIKDTWDKIVGVIDDIAVQLGLNPKPIPVRVKKDNDRNKR